MKRAGLIVAVLAILSGFGTVVLTALADGPIAGRVGRDEVRFMEGMSDHEQVALDIANNCLTKAKSLAVIGFCKNIVTAETSDITQMHNWLYSWYQTFYLPTSMSQEIQDSALVQTPESSMPAATVIYSDPNGMMGLMAGLNALDNKEYEIAFLEAMIDHHEYVVLMSQNILKTAQHKELRIFAQKTVDDETAEIQKMEGTITELDKNS